MMRWIIAALGYALLTCASLAQVGQIPTYLQPAPSVATYQGPGDVFTTSPYAWYSCARVFTAAQANTSTLMCDLVASTGGAAVCTLRGSSTGFVDLTAYCPGSLTPSAACAAASGGSCKISKMYDLTNSTRDALQPTSANQPPVAFSSTPASTLPSVQCSGGTVNLTTASTFTQATMFGSGVFIRTSGTALGGAIGANGSLLLLGTAATANNFLMTNSGSITAAATDNSWHAAVSVLNGASSVVRVDGGSDQTGSVSGGLVGEAIRLCRASASPLVGNIAEIGIWATTSVTGTDRTNVIANQRSSTNGYNF